MEPPDREEKVLRFGCGTIFGVAIALFALLRIGDAPWPDWLLAMAIVGVVCGFVAMRRGDAFWWSALEDRWWW